MVPWSTSPRQRCCPLHFGGDPPGLRWSADADAVAVAMAMAVAMAVAMAMSVAMAIIVLRCNHLLAAAFFHTCSHTTIPTYNVWFA